MIRKIKFMYHDIKWFFKNLQHFLGQAWYYRDFDSAYSIECFARNLDRLADALKRWNNHLHAERCYRRCKFAAHLLRQAYEGNYDIDDKSYINWRNNNIIYFDKLENSDFSVMKYRRKYSEEYSEKMFKVIHKRISTVEKQRKKEAWEYIHKYVETWWD